MKITPKKKKAWLAKARAAGGRGWASEVTLLKPVTTRDHYRVTETCPKVGDEVRLDDNDSNSPCGRVVVVGIGAVAVAVEAQAVLDWLDAG